MEEDEEGRSGVIRREIACGKFRRFCTMETSRAIIMRVDDLQILARSDPFFRRCELLVGPRCALMVFMGTAFN